WLRDIRRLLGPRNRGPSHAFSHGKNTPALLAIRRGLQSRGDSRPYPRLLPRRPGWPSCAGGAVGRDVRDPDHLRTRADDHARRRILFAAASSAQGGSSPRRACGATLARIRVMAVPQERGAPAWSVRLAATW